MKLLVNALAFAFFATSTCFILAALVLAGCMKRHVPIGDGVFIKDGEIEIKEMTDEEKEKWVI